MHRLVVQSLRGEQSARSRVESKPPQAEGIGAAQEREGQLVLLVSVRGADPQDLGPRWLVFGDVHLVHRLGELRPVVVGVNDADEHLSEQNKWERICIFFKQRKTGWLNKSKEIQSCVFLLCMHASIWEKEDVPTLG